MSPPYTRGRYQPRTIRHIRRAPATVYEYLTPKTTGIDTCTILTGTIDQVHLPPGSVLDNYITHQKMAASAVGSLQIIGNTLSALRAFLGTVTAGKLQTVGEGQAITVFDAYAIRSWDSRGSLTFEVKDGNVEGQSLRLIDPNCCCNYSCLSSGAWVYHDELGNTYNYPKRICAGTATAGDNVILCGWRCEPKIIISPKELLTFNVSEVTNCQQWCVYADVPVWFCTSATCWGYCFAVHAVLKRSSGIYAPTVVCLAEGTATCTHNDACVATVTICAQLWCHSGVIGEFYAYGTYCYAVCYRICGAPAWCACCYSVIQPHSSVAELQATFTDAHSIDFGSAHCWELMVCCVSVGWTATSFDGTLACCCCRTFTALDACICKPGLGSATLTCCVAFSGTKPDNVYCTYACYTWATKAPEHFTACGVSTTHCGQLLHGTAQVNCCVSAVSCAITCFSAPNINTDMGAFNGCTWDYLCLTAWVNTSNNCIGIAHVCLDAGFIYHCYCAAPAAATCSARLFYSYQDTSEAETVLDAAGILNWLAIAAG